MDVHDFVVLCFSDIYGNVPLVYALENKEEEIIQLLTQMLQ
jgi:hypothetical protein